MIERDASGLIQGQRPVEIFRIHLPGEIQLLEIIEAGDPQSFVFSLIERGAEQAGQNGDNGNHRGELDQGKPAHESQGTTGRQYCRTDRSGFLARYPHWAYIIVAGAQTAVTCRYSTCQQRRSGTESFGKS